METGSFIWALIATLRSARRSPGGRRLPEGQTVELRVRRRAYLTNGAAIAVVLIATGLARPARTSAQGLSDTGVTADMAVTVARARRMCFADSVQVSGVLTPRREILVRPDREGMQISQVLVEPGDSVVQGQILARLKPPDSQPGGGPTVTIQAPAAGIVSSRSAIIGTLASARAEPLFRIVGQGEMELQAEVPAQYLGSVAADQPAKMQILGIGEVQGKVRRISTAINPVTQLGEVHISVGNDSRLRVGVFGRAAINTAERCNVSIPLSALLYGSDGAVVQVVRDNRVETRRVVVGLLDSGTAEIREGLAEGDTVVARSGAFLREGDRVRPVLATAPAVRQ